MTTTRLHVILDLRLHGHVHPRAHNYANSSKYIAEEESQMKLLFMIAVIAILLYWGQGAVRTYMQPVGNVRCVIADQESQFIGAGLKTYSNVNSSIESQRECELKDTEQDGGSGPNAGKIRWVLCQQDQDCSKAGDY